MANARESADGYPGSTMAQQNLAFITGHGRGGGPLESTLTVQMERFARLGRKNIVIVMDTFPSLEEATMAALQSLLRRASDLGVRVSCVAMEERVASFLRPMQEQHDLRVIRHVDQIPGAAA